MTPKPWWQSDNYAGEYDVPVVFANYTGPKGVGLVKVWPSGETAKGWGLKPPEGSNDGFMPRYMRGEFLDRRVLYGYERDKWAFAFIMRSLKLVCLDIDGKNGGLEHAKKLGLLPPTLAETSKSGDGYHLFYLVDDEWDPKLGFAFLGDRIGIEQGVDFRGTGCVYHHKQQRWNNREVAMLPDHLIQVLQARDQKAAASNQRVTKILDSQDEVEILMLQDELTSELKKDIPPGKRNNTLYAIGSQMCFAGVPDWEDKLTTRATELGLDNDESDKLVANIKKYATVTP